MFKKVFSLLFSARKNKQTTKKEWLGNFIFLTAIAVFFSAMLGHKYYWQYQIYHHGIITEAQFAQQYHVRHKPLEPKRYFVAFAFTTNNNEKIISKTIEISTEDIENFHQNKPIMIRYAINKPEEIALLQPPPTLFIHFMPLLFTLFTIGMAFWAFLQWRKANKTSPLGKNQ